MTTFVWKIQELSCYPHKDGYQNVVYFVKWACTSTDGLKTETFSSDRLVPSPTDSFTPYDQLTEAQVLSWLWANGVDKDAVETNLTEVLAMMREPISITLDLPWSTI